jgi:hypothetical protein
MHCKDNVQAKAHLQEFECLASFENMWTDQQLTCDDVASFPAEMRAAIARGCCRSPPPAATQADSDSPYLVTKPVPCDGECVDLHGKCAGIGMDGRQPCCNPDDICMVRFTRLQHVQAHAGGLACTSYSKAKRHTSCVRHMWMQLRSLHS